MKFSELSPTAKAIACMDYMREVNQGRTANNMIDLWDAKKHLMEVNEIDQYTEDGAYIPTSRKD